MQVPENWFPCLTEETGVFLVEAVLMFVQAGLTHVLKTRLL